MLFPKKLLKKSISYLFREDTAVKVAGSNCEGDLAKDHDYGLQNEVYRRHVYRKVIWAYHINQNKNRT
jgi:hypothetical protein